jgi:hypothetical protein
MAHVQLIDNGETAPLSIIEQTSACALDDYARGHTSWLDSSFPVPSLGSCRTLSPFVRQFVAENHLHEENLSHLFTQTTWVEASRRRHLTN